MGKWSILAVLILLPCLAAYAVFRRIGQGGRNRLSPWKTVLLVVVFGATLAPYSVIAMTIGLQDIAYCFLVWVFFFIGRSLLPHGMSIVAAIVCGVMLSIPASTFVYLDEGRVTFYNGLPNLLNGYSMVTAVSYFVGLFVAAHFLLRTSGSGREITASPGAIK
jgi:hypothetical protein